AARARARTASPRPRRAARVRAAAPPPCSGRRRWRPAAPAPGRPAAAGPRRGAPPRGRTACARRAGLPVRSVCLPSARSVHAMAATIGGPDRMLQSPRSCIAHDRRQVTRAHGRHSLCPAVPACRGFAESRLRSPAAYSNAATSARDNRPAGANHAPSDFRALGPRCSCRHTRRFPPSRSTMNTNAELLKELRIDRKAPPPTPRRGLWITLAVVAVVLLAAGAAWAIFGRDRGIEVQVATVQAIGGSGGSASVLDATGYVVARRMATVSAKITGKVLDVRIEEGQRVEEGDVMATLDPVDADAERSLAASQLAAARSQIDGVQAQLHEAEVDVKRLATLVGQQLVSKSQYDQAVARRDALRAQLATAQRNAKVAADRLAIADNG